MEDALRALLTGYAPLAALVSTRIYWNAIPQDAADPCVVMYVITRPRTYVYGGPVGLTGSLIQVNVRALTVNSMWAVSRAIIARCDGYRGGAFDAIFVRDERQDSEKPGTVLYQTNQIDIEAWHQPA